MMLLLFVFSFTIDVKVDDTNNCVVCEQYSVLVHACHVHVLVHLYVQVHKLITYTCTCFIACTCTCIHVNQQVQVQAVHVHVQVYIDWFELVSLNAFCCGCN